MRWILVFIRWKTNHKSIITFHRYLKNRSKKENGKKNIDQNLTAKRRYLSTLKLVYFLISNSLNPVQVNYTLWIVLTCALRATKHLWLVACCLTTAGGSGHLSLTIGQSLIMLPPNSGTSLNDHVRPSIGTVTWLDKIREFCSRCALEIYMKKRYSTVMEGK